MNSRSNMGVKKHGAFQQLLLVVVGIGLFAGFYFVSSVSASPPQGILAQLNQKLSALEQEMSKAKSDQVHELSPKVFLEAQENLEKAKADLEKGRDVKSIQKKLDKADELLGIAVRNANEARKQLPDLIAARDDALASGAPEYAPELFEKAEKNFKDAMREIEDSDINNAIRKGREGETMFQDAELNAIKISIIGKVHTMLDQAEDEKIEEYAPLTLSNAKALIQEAEEILNTDRSAQATAREKAEAAEYEIKHAMYIHRVVDSHQEDDASWEQFILSHEDKVADVANQLKFKTRFDKGIEEPMNSIRLAVVTIQDENKQLKKELDEKNSEIVRLANDISQLTSALDETKQKEAGLQEKLEAKKRREAKIKRVEDLFTDEEAVVLIEGTNLKVRLVGLSFPIGKSEIEVQYFSLLTKVQQAIREFPDSQITIEGHTDSRGHDTINLRLSKERAESVMAYLQANMSIAEERILAVGYGKEKPIATNETEEGRKINRRIDVVLEIGEVE